MLFPGDASPRGKHAGAYDPGTSMTRKFFKAALVLVCVALLAWPAIEPWLLQVETVSLVSGDLPSGVGQLRIAYATDIHKGGLFNENRVNGLIQQLNACNADIILLGGDYASDSDGAIEFFRTMPQLRAKYGVYAVLGNHDRTLPEGNLATLQTAMIAAGVMPLVNAVTKVRIGASDIYIAGLDDVNNGHPDLANVARQVSATDYVIFLCHSPAIIPDALAAQDKTGSTRCWFDLGLFGHTHGGQAAIIGPLLRKSDIPAEYFSGWVTRSRAEMLISNGVGTCGLPLRWLCPPQIHIITVTTGK